MLRFVKGVLNASITQPIQKYAAKSQIFQYDIVSPFQPQNMAGGSDIRPLNRRKKIS